MPTEEQIRAWARDEWERAEAGKQALCLHARSGTLRDDAVVVCDQCGKVLTPDDVHFGAGDALSRVEQRYINKDGRA